jgi:predicted enzyme related to lactoylglutathione lyase
MADAPKAGEFCWNELATGNVETAKNFYGKLFGWEFQEHQMPDMTYTMAKANNKDVAGFWAIPKEQQKQMSPHWLSYILVEDVEESVKKAASLGASIVKPVSRAGDFGSFAVIRDPVGAHIALWQPAQR